MAAQGDFYGEKTLIIEDETGIKEILEHTFQKEGFIVNAVTTAEEGIALPNFLR